MKVGMVLPQMGEVATRDNILYTAREAEKEGFDSLWVLDRLLWPLKPRTPYGGTPDGSLPAVYQNVLDPLTTLTYVAANTDQISLGTSVIDMLLRSPVALAKGLATLDVLSEGRVIPGLGLGWSIDEYEVSGVPFKGKGSRADEFLQALRRTWTDDVVQFKGEFYNIPDSKIGPKPIQKPHPLILLGGFNAKTFSRIINYADGWLGVAGIGPLEGIEQMINGLREGTRKAGRDSSSVKVYILTYPNVLDSHSSSSQARSPMTGTIDQIGSDIEQIKRMHVEHIMFGHLFSAIGKDMRKMIEVTKQLAQFAK